MACISKKILLLNPWNRTLPIIIEVVQANKTSSTSPTLLSSLQHNPVGAISKIIPIIPTSLNFGRNNQSGLVSIVAVQYKFLTTEEH